MTNRTSIIGNASATQRIRRFASLCLRLFLTAGVIFFCGHAEAKTKKKKKSSSSHESSHSSSSGSHKHSGSSSSSKHHTASSTKKAQDTNVELRPENYPTEISGRVKLYNADVKEINDLRKKDPKLAKARGEVLKIQKESFEVYTTYMSSVSGREADKIRKTVAQNGWYKGMPQIAFVVSMGLPDDVQSASQKDTTQLKLFYKSGVYSFEKGKLRSFDKAK